MKKFETAENGFLYQKTVAIIGYGSIGKAIAQRIKGFNTKYLL
ncbi:MAG: NAD(P)-dependent oxidoreductase [Dialister invisus]